MKKINIGLSVVSVFVTACLSGCSGNGGNNDSSNNKVSYKEYPVRISDVDDVQGFIGSRMELNKKYINDFPIDKYVDFVVRREHTEWDWTQAEQHGKWMESAYMTAIQSGDQALMDKAHEVLYKIIASQEESGYLGATALSYRSDDRPIRGMDPYELYYVFHALITVYEETGDQVALDSAQKLAGYFLKYFGPGKLEFWPSSLRDPENKGKELEGHSDFAGHSVHYSWEGTLLCDPIARLYEVTGKKEYLDWAKWVVSDIDKWSGWDSFSRLDDVAAGKLEVNELQPYVHAHTFHMNFMGFLRLYRITGDETLLKKVVGAWNDIYRRQMYITGGVSVAEHYENGYVKPVSGNIIETCATMSWMQLTQMLLQITGDPKYADAIEKIMLNHVFAAQDFLTGTCRYHTAPNRTKPNGYFHGPDCCTASGHRIISMLPTFFFAMDGNDLYINQFVPCKLSGKKVSLTIGGDYPQTDSFRITIDGCGKKAFAVNLRIPSWCEAPAVSVNGEKVAAEPGKYLTVSRKWKAGDYIDVNFPMEVKWVEREHHYVYESHTLPGGEIMYEAKPSDKAPYAFERGPVVYCFDAIWNPQLTDKNVDIENDLRVDVSSVPSVTENPSPSEVFGPVYAARATYKGDDVDIVMTPFATIGRWFREGENEPSRDSDAYSYGIWLTKEE